jgi:hypothetical protein
MISMVLRGFINVVVCMQIAAFVGHLSSVYFYFFSFLQEVSTLMSRCPFLDEEWNISNTCWSYPGDIVNICLEH